MKKISFLILIMALACISANVYAETPAAILQKAAANIKKAGKVSCGFTVSGKNGSVRGSINTEGSKFKLHTPQSTTWFDGTHMWTSNSHTKEITLVSPSASEVRESNPFAYLNSYQNDFNVFLSKRKEAGRHLILLNPKKKNTGLKAVEIALNQKTLLPERFIVRDDHDNVTTVTINSLSLKSNPGPGGYVCPVETMKDYELIDLR